MLILRHEMNFMDVKPKKLMLSKVNDQTWKSHRQNFLCSFREITIYDSKFWLSISKNKQIQWSLRRRFHWIDILCIWYWTIQLSFYFGVVASRVGWGQWALMRALETDRLSPLATPQLALALSKTMAHCQWAKFNNSHEQSKYQRKV